MCAGPRLLQCMALFLSYRVMPHTGKSPTAIIDWWFVDDRRGLVQGGLRPTGASAGVARDRHLVTVALRVVSRSRGTGDLFGCWIALEKAVLFGALPVRHREAFPRKQKMDTIFLKALPLMAMRVSASHLPRCSTDAISHTQE